MTTNEIIKAMDEFAALQAKATEGPWVASLGIADHYHIRSSGHTRQEYNGRHLLIAATTPRNTDSSLAFQPAASTDSEDEANANILAASRSIPATEAAALIREMREMLRAVEQGASECMVCKTNLNQYENHAPDCKLAQILKD